MALVGLHLHWNILFLYARHMYDILPIPWVFTFLDTNLPTLHVLCHDLVCVILSHVCLDLHWISRRGLFTHDVPYILIPSPYAFWHHVTLRLEVASPFALTSCCQRLSITCIMSPRPFCPCTAWPSSMSHSTLVGIYIHKCIKLVVLHHFACLTKFCIILRVWRNLTSFCMFFSLYIVFRILLKFCIILCFTQFCIVLRVLVNFCIVLHACVDFHTVLHAFVFLTLSCLVSRVSILFMPR